MTTATTSRRADLTFRHNISRGRHGWLRLTPAYSVKVVTEILAAYSTPQTVLDPFSGTGTTGLVCAEGGSHCDLLDVNPFLVWLAATKTKDFSVTELRAFKSGMRKVLRRVESAGTKSRWAPPIHAIERWWSPSRLSLLSTLFDGISKEFGTDDGARDLAHLVFCRCLIDWSNAAFNHQSMSFKEAPDSLFDDMETPMLLGEASGHVTRIAEAAEVGLPGSVVVREADSRAIPAPTSGPYDLVITSPPYPNRMSYIRELRPYMYWLKYLQDAREAGELDWKAIGGTWGIATSRVEKWVPNGTTVPFAGFERLIGKIEVRSVVLARYVHKYFDDMVHHLKSLRPHVRSGGRIHYVVGNSVFYETVVPVEKIFAAIMKSSGFEKTTITTLRKRNSKKELLEFDVSAVAG